MIKLTRDQKEFHKKIRAAGGIVQRFPGRWEDALGHRVSAIMCLRLMAADRLIPNGDALFATAPSQTYQVL